MSTSPFKIAFIHDRLVYPGWAEKVFFDLIKDVLNKDWYYWKLVESYNFKNPQTKIFTTFHNPDFPTPIKIPIGAVIKTPKVSSFSRQLLPVYPILQKILSKKIRQYKPDLVIISSFAIAKNLDLWNIPKILYLHSPMQYIWSHYEEYLNNPYFQKSKFKKLIFQLSSKYLRKWDWKYTDFNKIFFNSQYTYKTFKQVYNKNPSNYEILHPKVEIPSYQKVDISKKYNLPKNYYLYIGRVVKFVKKLDQIIKHFNQTWENLVIVGDGPDFEELKKLAKPNIKFLWYISYEKDDYWNLLENCKALINLTKESFWIVNYQALLMWKPIICKPHGAIKEMKGKKIYIDF